MAVINNNINNKVGASNSGVTNTLTVDNASNTASSVAFTSITVGGSSAGDAFETFTVAGTTNWSQGVDNSDSDAYVLAASTALGTTNVMRAQTTGEINYPLQSAFEATVGSALTNVVGNSATPYVIVFATVIFDQNSDYNNSTGTFTAPVTGRYQLSGEARITSLTAAMTFGSIQLTASNRTLIGERLNVGLVRTIDSTPDITNLTEYVLMDMDAADTVTCAIIINGGVSASAGITANTHFSGFLAC